MINYFKTSKEKYAAVLPDGSYIECYTDGDYTFFAVGIAPGIKQDIERRWQAASEAEFQAVSEKATKSIVNLLDIFATHEKAV
ncbi:hypothetical protein ACFSR6_03425 [Pedobacter vanadiisoli]|uniref:Uncharacterized protein n=1 Tax=Pedobacter vanadiisoli TaxID=1761975 RepID=A0ABW5ME84_9SPHI